MALRDIFRRRKPEEQVPQQDNGMSGLMGVLGQAEGYERIRPGNQIIQPHTREEEGDIPDESAVRSGAEDDAFNAGRRMGIQSMLRAQGVDTRAYGEQQDLGIINKEHVRKAFLDLVKYRTGNTALSSGLSKVSSGGSCATGTLSRLKKLLQAYSPYRAARPGFSTVSPGSTRK